MAVPVEAPFPLLVRNAGACWRPPLGNAARRRAANEPGRGGHEEAEVTVGPGVELEVGKVILFGPFIARDYTNQG